MLRAALLALLTEHQRDDAIPTSNRFLFYELEGRGIVSKEQKGKRRPDQDMTEALTQLRESGQIPWNWIVDETRSLESFIGSATIKDWMLEALPAATLDPWNGEAPMILTESRSLAGVLRNQVYQYGAQVAPTNGQCAGFLHTEVSPRLRPYHQILYLGDFDLCGFRLSASTVRDPPFSHQSRLTASRSAPREHERGYTQHFGLARRPAYRARLCNSQARV